MDPNFKYRIDIVLSYWIFIWYILYVNKIVPSSPKLALILASIENILYFGALIYVSAPVNIIVLFVIINIGIKVLPLVSIWGDTIHLYRDLYVLAMVIIVYYMWVYFVAGTKIIDRQFEVMKMLSEGKYTPGYTPMTSLIEYLWK